MEANTTCGTRVGSFGAPEVVFWIRGIALTSVALLGIIGNVLCGLTFSKMRRNTSFAVFLLCLSFSDTVILVSCIFVVGLVSIVGELALVPVYPYFVVVFYPLMLIAQTCSAYLITTVSIERYLAVCKPFSSYRSPYSMTSKWRAYAICGAIGVGAIVLNLPRFVEYGVGLCTKPTGQMDEFDVILTKSAMRQNWHYKVYYRFIMVMIVVFVIPTLLLIVFNGIIYKTIRKANQVRQNLSQAQKMENSLAAMLACVVLVYLLCNTLPIVNNIQEYQDVHNLPTLQICLSDLLVVLNSSVNFAIYFASGKRFRKQFMHLWCGVKPERLSDQEINMTIGKNISVGKTVSTSPSSPAVPVRNEANGMGTSVNNNESAAHKDGIDNGGFEAL